MDKMSWFRAEVSILGGLALAGIGVAAEVVPAESWLHGYSRTFYILAGLWWLLALLHWGFRGLRSWSRRRSGSPTEAGHAVIDTPTVEIDVHVRVYRALSETGNAASEPYRRWLHLMAENWSSIPVRDARVSVRFQGRDYGGGWQDWYWTDAREVVDLVRGSPIAIPIALADIAEPRGPEGVAALLYSHNHYQVGQWFLTPKGHTGALAEVKPGRYFISVEIKWATGKTEPEHFILDLTAKNSPIEPELIHIVAKERY